MTDEASQIIVCQACGQKMKIPGSGAGKTFKCVKCGAAIPPPEAIAEPAAAESASEEAAQRARIGQLLIGEGLISKAQLEEGLAFQQEKGGKIIQVLLGLGHLTEDVLHTFLSTQPGIASIDLARVKIDTALLDLVPRELALEFQVLPVDRLGKLLTVAMACPIDTCTIKEIERITGLRVRGMLCRLKDIHGAVAKYYASDEEEAASSELDEYFAKIMGATGAAAGKSKETEAQPVNVQLAERLSAMARDRAVSLVDVIDAVAENPKLTEALIEVANSEAFGFDGAVDSLPAAVALLDKGGVSAIAARMTGHARVN